MVDELPAKRLKRSKARAVAPPPPARYQAFIDGVLTVEDLDDDEVFKLRLRNKDGSFSGRPPISLPNVFLEAMRREQHKRFTANMAAKVAAAEATIDRLMDPAHVPGASDATAFKAAQFVIERFAGKTPDNVNIKAEVTSKWDDAMDDVIIEVDVEEEDDDFSTGRA